jgi:hypothetical protein
MKAIIFILFSVIAFSNLSFKGKYEREKFNSIADSVKIDSATGFKIDKGVELVTAHCTGCHSNKLIVNFGADKKGWLEKIRWMQKTQKLWQLGDAEPQILDYLAKNYPPIPKYTRREPLKNINWYKLQN